MITTIRETDYVRNKVDGQVTIRELLEYAQSNVETWISEPVLWNLTNAALKEDKSDYLAIRGIVGNIHDLAQKREGRKTVFAVPDPCSYGMLRMAITIVEINESHFIASVFNNLEAAEEWLKEADIDSES